MTPRKQLADEILRTDGRKPTRTLKPYAIGRWVSVEERLPEDRQTVVTRWDYGAVSFITMVKDGKWSFYSNDSKITHWLELDLPEVGNE